MTADPDVLSENWRQAAREVYEILCRGEDCCFLTLGDALLYSTYIYLLRELQTIDPAVQVVTVPGITAFSAAAALTNCPVGEGKQLVTIVPASDDFSQFTQALDRPGTVVLMKVGRRLEKVLDELEARGLLDQAVFVARGHAGAADRDGRAAIARTGGTDRIPFDPDYPGKPAVAGQKGGSAMKVHFVGAGPGDPELLTVKALRLLESARLCIYAGSLVNPALLGLLPAEARTLRFRHDEPR